MKTIIKHTVGFLYHIIVGVLNLFGLNSLSRKIRWLYITFITWLK